MSTKEVIFSVKEREGERARGREERELEAEEIIGRGVGQGGK